MRRQCACGCGRLTTNKMYVYGHNRRGVPVSPETLDKRSGRNHHLWKGDKAGYAALHRWLIRHKPRTGICEHCGDQRKPGRDGRPGTDFANISGEYRRDIDDYVELCKPCHRVFDGQGERRESVGSR